MDTWSKVSEYFIDESFTDYMENRWTFCDIHDRELGGVLFHSGD